MLVMHPKNISLSLGFKKYELLLEIVLRVVFSKGDVGGT